MLAPLVASIVELLISSVVRGISGRGVRRAGRGYMDKKILVQLHPLNNIVITYYFNYKPKFNGVFSRNNLPRIKDEAFVINLDEKKKSNRTHWLSLFIDKNTSVYFVSYGINYIPQEELSKIRK